MKDGFQKKNRAYENEIECMKTLAAKLADRIPEVPGPEIADPNIMELCFHNGERHMKEKIANELTRIAEKIPCITVAQAIAMIEGL